MTARESPNSPNKSRDGGWEIVYRTEGTTDEVQAIQSVYQLQPPIIFRGQPKKPGESLRWIGRGIGEVTLEYGFTGKDEDDPQGDLPTLGTLEIKGSGGTFHTTQCLSQVGYPVGKGDGVVASKAVGLHRDGVNGVDIHVSGSNYTLTKKWLPAAISGGYIDGLDELQGKMNASPYTIQWGFNKQAYSIACDAGELLFVDYDAKTSFTRAGIGIWEFSYEFVRIKNRSNIVLGNNKINQPITVPFKRGHDYLWVWYSRKEIANPSVYIEVPEMAFVSQVYYTDNFAQKLGF